MRGGIVPPAEHFDRGVAFGPGGGAFDPNPPATKKSWYSRPGVWGGVAVVAAASVAFTLDFRAGADAWDP
jgi:hypothetical protein